MLKNALHKIATLGFIGFLPYAPGSFGSAVSFFLVLLFRPGDVTLLIVIIPCFILGVAASDVSEKLLGKDSGHIIIDEFCGYLVSVLFVPKSAGCLIAAFVLFRIFDIFKPPPIRRMEEVFAGGAGIMADDVMAGIYANLCIQLWLYVF